MEFMDIFTNFIASVTPHEWTIAGIASFVALTALRGLFMFTFIIKIPEAIERSNLPSIVKDLGNLIFIVLEKVGVVYDVAINVGIMSLVFLDPPGGWHTFSYRMGKYIAEGDGWRKAIAVRVCKVLSMVDEGHCTKIFFRSF